MTRKQLEKRLHAICTKKATLHGKAVNLVNEYMEQHPEGLSETQQDDPSGHWSIERFVEDGMLHAAWVRDRLCGRVGMVGSDTYKKSLTKKVRRILGYTL